MTTEIEEREPELAPLSDADLGTLDRQAAEIEAAAPGVAEMFQAIRSGVGAERDSRARSQHRRLQLPRRLRSAPDAIVHDQREAMVRSIRLREDAHLPDGARSVWATVVARLGRMRHEAKELLGERRRAADPTESGWLATEGASQDAALAHEVLSEVPTDSGGTLSHLGANGAAGEADGLSLADPRRSQGRENDPTINQHGRA